MAAANNDRRAFRFASVWAREEVSENFKEQLAPFLVDVVALRSHVINYKHGQKCDYNAPHWAAMKRNPARHDSNCRRSARS